MRRNPLLAAGTALGSAGIFWTDTPTWRHTLASHRRWVTDGLPIPRASLQPSLRDTLTAPNLLIYSILKRELVDSSALLPKNSRLSVVK